MRLGCGAHCNCFRISIVTDKFLLAGILITRLPIYRIFDLPRLAESRGRKDERTTDEQSGKSKRREPQSNSKRGSAKRAGPADNSASTPTPPIVGLCIPQAYHTNTWPLQHHTTPRRTSVPKTGAGHCPVAAWSSKLGFEREQALRSMRVAPSLRRGSRYIISTRTLLSNANSYL